MAKKRHAGILKLLKLTTDPLKFRFISDTKAEDIADVFAPVARPSAPGRARNPLSEQEKYWLAWGRLVVEVAECLDTLDLATEFLGRATPPIASGRRTPDEARCIEYHLHVYLQEEIILRNRIYAVLNRLKKLAQHKRDSDGTNLVKSLKERVEGAFVNPSKARHAHVHEQKWHDAEIKKLGSMILYTGIFEAIGAPQKLLRLSRRAKTAEHTKLRKKWKTELSKNNEVIGSFCDDVCKGIASLLSRYEPSTDPKA
jgi:hypothetical protein